jgi:enamine deaminase RidA (YjgF/YER057c/UK114 family)
MIRPAVFAARRGPYSPGVLAQSPTAILLVAGQVAVGGDGAVVGAGQFASQARKIFENIGAVLAEADMDFSNVVKFTNYLVNPDDLGELRTVRAALWEEFFPDGNYPADTLLVVSRLARPEYLLEIECVAARC